MTTMTQRIRRAKIGTDLRIRPEKLRTRRLRKAGENHLVKNREYTRAEARAHVKEVECMTRKEYRVQLLLAIHNATSRRDHIVWSSSFAASNPYRSKESMLSLSLDSAVTEEPHSGPV